MSRFKLSVLLVGCCLFLSVAGFSQVSRLGGRSTDSSTTFARSDELDSASARTVITAGTQASGASSGTIVPRLMRFSGALHDAAGKPLSGTVDVTFSLYNTEAGGDALWFETQSVQADELGRYTALLGAMHADGLPTELFTSGEVRWLGIQVGTETEQQPRVLMVSVPYALKAGDAETLGGKPASAYMLADTQNGTNSAATSSISDTDTAPKGTSPKTKKGRITNNSALVSACTSVSSNAGGAVNSIALFDATCDIQSSAITQSGNFIGIGTTSPNRTLTLVDNTNLIQFELQSSNVTTGPNLFLNNKGSANGGKYLRSLGGSFQVVNNAYSAALLTIQDNGNVGIGTSAPTRKLTVVDNTNLVQFELQSTNATTGPNLLLSNVGTTNGGKYLRSYGGSFQVVNNAYSAALLTIQDGGNLGIGTTTPAAKLEVNGTAQFDGLATFAAGQTVTGSVSTASQLISTVATGTAPLSVTSTTQVPNLNASQLGGFSASAFAQLASPNSFTGNQSVTGNVTATMFAGSGAGLTNLPASSLAGGIAVGGTGAGGITVALNGTSPDLVNGYSGNTISGGLFGATISGGGASGFANSITASYATIAGGIQNTASGSEAAVGGGQNNTASGSWAVIGGGASNTASGSFATIVGGGTGNTAFANNSSIGGGTNNFTGDTLVTDHTIGVDATVGGGKGNSASGGYSTIPGGDSNTTGASADHSFAAGFGAVANHTGTFVWADNVGAGTKTAFTSTANNQFLIRASGGVGIGTASPQATLDTAGQDRRKPVAFSTLAACSGTIEGETAAVTDSATATWGTTITGGGANHVLAYCDGTNWTVAAL